jgi:malonyl CoA-acyl carrier protein transacylase
MSAQYLVWGVGVAQIVRYRHLARRDLRERDPEAYAALRAGESITP